MESPEELFEDASTFEEESKPAKGVFHNHLDEKVRPYIDLIDSLRLIGIEKDLALPAIAVIGDQSSGKSSVLEALSGVALPRGSGIVTRCPLELKLRKLRGGGQWRASISYEEEKIQFEDPSLVQGHVVKAQDKLAGKGVGICNKLITLEVCSPDVCDLTLIDLPGIARVPVKNQPEDIGDQIKRLILNFILKTETIVLVVVACNVDIATTEALKMAQQVDPEGKRTLAILTKPDLIDRGTEKNVLEIVQNQVIPLSKGYIIVKCRGQKQIDDGIPLSDAIKIERDFFQQHKYFSGLPDEKKATMQCLATKLTHNLVEHIKKSLPLICEQITKQLWDTKKELTLCEAGPPLETQRRKIYLIDTITQFNAEINQLCSGEVVNKENLFIQLRSEFKNWKEWLDGAKGKGKFNKEVQEVVREYNEKHRGCELPGFYTYTVFQKAIQRLVAELKWPAIDTMKSVRDTIQKQYTDVANISFMNYPFLQCFSLNKIDNIQSRQQALAHERILEQFEMEHLVYTQDDIYFKTLNKLMDEDEEKANEDGSTEVSLDFDRKLKAYYKIVAQRLADQVPMLIKFFLLKQSGQMLGREMLNLIDGGNVNEILREDSDISRRRIDMENRVERLTLAHKKMANFL
ncbi:hypothetical protein SKAU_G00239750 [Synaphobranchus kaupii]|uniref:Uncharacterized protein n=1 Tax=Synaphobranchus kaupii TaxID=118154 RepID=A0A9Q1F7T0_SYNKA|nr:hypothetical protein SKAU_G00239750 [Synaphobranchus kaupii]